MHCGWRSRNRALRGKYLKVDAVYSSGAWISHSARFAMPSWADGPRPPGTARRRGASGYSGLSRIVTVSGRFSLTGMYIAY
jgi:hypothetical protein